MLRQQGRTFCGVNVAIDYLEVWQAPIAPGDSAEALEPAAIDRLSLLIFWPKLTCARRRGLKPSPQIIRHGTTRLPENFRILGEAQQIISLDGHLCGVKLNGLYFQIA